MIQTAQTAACNRVHELEERLARWLLTCHDRMQSDYLAITHEFLAMMLGTRRSSVTVAAGILHKAGRIAYSRGHVTIQNRDLLLEAFASAIRSSAMNMLSSAFYSFQFTLRVSFAPSFERLSIAIVDTVKVTRSRQPNQKIGIVSHMFAM